MSYGGVIPTAGLIFRAVCAMASADENLLNSFPRSCLAFIRFELSVSCPELLIILISSFIIKTKQIQVPCNYRFSHISQALR